MQKWDPSKHKIQATCFLNIHNFKEVILGWLCLQIHKEKFSRVTLLVNIRAAIGLHEAAGGWSYMLTGPIGCLSSITCPCCLHVGMSGSMIPRWKTMHDWSNAHVASIALSVYFWMWYNSVGAFQFTLPHIRSGCPLAKGKGDGTGGVWPPISYVRWPFSSGHCICR